MRASTAYNRKQEARSRIIDVFSRLRLHHQTADWLNAELRKVYDETLKGVPQYVREYANGYKDCLYQSVWREVEFCYLIEGKWYTTNRNSESGRPHWETTGIYDMSGKEYCHMWIHADKPYTRIMKAL